MELYQFFWGVFALLVGWSVFFMPPLSFGAKALTTLLRVQQVMLLAGALSLWFYPRLYGSPAGFWAEYSDTLHPFSAIGLTVIAGFLFYLARKNIATHDNHLAEKGKDAFQLAFLREKRFPVWPEQVLASCVDSFCEQIGLDLRQLLVVEAEPLPYKEAKPGKPNAGATGSAFSGVGVVIFSTELLANLRPRCFDAIVIHELAHIKNNDNLRIAFLRSVVFGAVFMAILGAVVYGFSYVPVVNTFMAAFLFGLALSRKMEALADIEAARHGYGYDLAEALETISFEGEQKEEKSVLRFLTFLRTHPKTSWRTNMCRTLRF